jgi:hypothetical protein
MFSLTCSLNEPTTKPPNCVLLGTMAAVVSGQVASQSVPAAFDTVQYADSVEVSDISV